MACLTRTLTVAAFLVCCAGQETSTSSPATSTTSTSTTTTTTSTKSSSGGRDGGRKKDKRFTGDPQIDWQFDPNYPRELRGYNMTGYPFFSRVPNKMKYDCKDRIDGFYANMDYKCQVRIPIYIGSGKGRRRPAARVSTAAPLPPPPPALRQTTTSPAPPLPLPTTPALRLQLPDVEYSENEVVPDRELEQDRGRARDRPSQRLSVAGRRAAASLFSRVRALPRSNTTAKPRESARQRLLGARRPQRRRRPVFEDLEYDYDVPTERTRRVGRPRRRDIT